MARRDIPLPDTFEILLGKDHDEWPAGASLLVAAYHGDVHRLKEIAKSMDMDGNGIPVTLANASFLGMNALHAACDLGKLPILRYLVEELNMDVNKPDTARGFIPAEHAVCNGHLPALRFLLDHGTNMHQERKGVTLLSAAAEKGQTEIAKFLLSRGARVNADSTFLTQLFIASFRGYASIVKILLEHNANFLRAVDA